MSNVPTNLIPTKITGLPEYTGSSTLGYLPYVLEGRTYKVQFANIAAVGAVPSTREINTGTGLGGGGDLSANRTLYILPQGVDDSRLTLSGVTAGVYGGADSVPVLTVNAQGRVTAATSVPIVLSNYVPTSRTITAGAGLTGGGDLSANRSFAVSFSSTTPEPLGTGSPGVSTVAARGDHVHPAVDLSDTTETQGVLPLSRGGTGNSLSPVAGAIVYSSNDKLYLTTAGSVGQVLRSGGPGGVPFWTDVGAGTVTSVAVATANGFAGTVVSPTLSPVITLSTTVTGLLKGDGTGMSAATAGVDYVAPGAYTASGLTMATARLLGRTTASVGAAQEITVGTGLTLASGSLVNAAPDQVVSLTGGTAISVTGTYPSFTVTNTAPDQVVSLTGAGTTVVTGTYPNFTITSNDSTAGTVTSVNASGGTTGMSFTGGPITSAGTLTLNGTLAVANGGTGATDAVAALTNLGAYPASNPAGYTSNVGTVTSVSGTGTVSGLSLSGTVTSAGSLTLGGTLAVLPSNFASQTANTVLAAPNGSAGVPTFRAIVAADIPTLNQNTTGTASNVTGIVAVANGGTGASVAATARTNLGAAASGANTDITSIALTTGTISAAPTNGTDIVNKTYADSIASGINFHQSVRLATTAALPANTYNNGASGVGATLTANANGALSIDGVAVVAANRVLIKNEVTQANNGVYTVTQVGNGSTPYILTRATDFDSAGAGVNKIDAGDFFLVTAGSTLANTSWVQQTPLPITVGTTAIVFTQFAAPVLYTAGTGLTLAGTVFSITNTGVTASTYGSASSVPVLAINAQGQVTSASSSSIAIAASQITSGALAIANGGTGATSAATALTNLGAYPASNPNGYTSNTGTVTSVNLTAGTGISVSGGPVTASGSITVVNTAPDQVVSLTGSGATTVTGTYPNFTISSPASGAGTVTSINVSGGTTGLTTSGGPVTSSGTITLAGTLGVANGGTGATTLSSGYVLKGNGTSAVSASVIYDNGTNAGIGTATPQALLALGSGSAAASNPTYGGSLLIASQMSSLAQTGGIEFRSVNFASGYGHRISSPDLGAGNTPLVFERRTNSVSWTESMRIDSDGVMKLSVGGVSSTHQFFYNESGGEIQLIDSTGAGPILLDNAGGLARLYKVGTGAMSIGTTGANYLQFITNGSDRLNINSSGNVIAAVDMRAPIFYDSNNTAYYVDAASTSVLANLNMATGASSNIFIGRNSTATNYNSISLNGNSADASNMGMTGGGVGDNTLYINSTGNITVRTSSFSNSFSFSGGTFSAPGDLRAPIFYDSNNTGYYLDPASTSNLYRTNGDGFAASQFLCGLTNYGDQTNGSTWYGIGRSTVAGWTPGGMVQAAGYTGLRLRGAYSVIDLDGPVGANLINFTTDTARFIGNVRATIFYDIDNTAYYGDFASTSNLNALTLASGEVLGAAITFNNMNQVHGQQSDFNAITNFGVRYVQGSINGPGISGAGQYYGFSLGLGSNYPYSDYGSQFYWPRTPIGGLPYPSVRFREGGTWGSWSKIYAGWADAPSGSTFAATGDFRAPIFYDSNDTAYYVDANNTSNFYRLSSYIAARDANANWNTGFTNTPAYSYNYNGDLNGGTNAPAAGWWFYESMRHSNASNYWGTQIAWGWEDNANRMLQRNVTGGSFGSWVEYLNTSNRTYNGNLNMTGSIISTSSDVRAPVFYDQNNTAFYYDGAGTTNINLLAGNGKTILETYDSYLRINQGSTFGSGCWFGGTLIKADGYYAGSNGDPAVSRVRIVGGSYNGSVVITLDGSTGNITAAGNVTAYSDIRVKDNVETIPDALNKLSAIRGVTYTRTDMEDKDRRYAGVIAQEIEQVLPEAIFDNVDYKSVDYNATIGLLIEAIKELENKVTTLESRLH